MGTCAVSGGAAMKWGLSFLNWGRGDATSTQRPQPRNPGDQGRSQKLQNHTSSQYSPANLPPRESEDD